MSGRYGFVVRRLVALPASLVVISMLVFALMHLVPGDAAQLIAGDRATDAQIEQIRISMKLDQPLAMQYLAYVGRLLHGDLGRTANGGSAVADIIATNIQPTLWLALCSMVLTLVAATVVAAWITRRPGGIADTTVRALSAVAFGMPVFWVGLMLLLFIAIPLGMPIGGWPEDFGGRAVRLVLPSLTVAITLGPLLVRSLRSSLLEVQGADYVTVGRALGLSGLGLVRRYVLRNAVIPSVPLIALVMAYVLGGIVMIETTFGLPGLGQALVQAAQSRDVNLLQGLTLVIASMVILVNLVADVLVAALDPRVKVS